jgi:hypothetical protein
MTTNDNLCETATRRGLGRLIPAAALAGVLCCAPGFARADEGEADAPEPLSYGGRERSFGVGTALGGGMSAAKDPYGSSLVSPAFLGPTLELQLFLPREYSIDVSVPITNIAVVSALVKGFYFNMDAFFNANVGRGTTRFVIGPGLGFATLSAGPASASSLRIPGQLGFEVLSKKRTFGFKMLARPFAEVAFGTAGSATGGGIMGALVFTGYTLSGPPASDVAAYRGP